MMKYRLRKNLPCAKAGEIFREDFDENNIVYLYQESYGLKQHKICLEDIDNFDEWFEEVEEPKQYFSINLLKATVEEIMNTHHSEGAIENMKSIGMLFESRGQAEDYLKYLRATAIIKQDAKGFKPDWTNNSEIKYFGYLHFEKIEFGIAVKENKFGRERMNKTTTIYFQSEEDIKDSLEKHPGEWRVCLTYEQ